MYGVTNLAPNPCCSFITKHCQMNDACIRNCAQSWHHILWTHISILFEFECLSVVILLCLCNEGHSVVWQSRSMYIFNDVCTQQYYAITSNLLTYLLTYIIAYLLSYLLTFLLTYFLIYLLLSYLLT